MAQDAPGQQQAGAQVSGYRLLSGLGRGNTSRVYLAEKLDSGPATSQVRAGTRVAVKVPLPETLSNQGAAERFANEVRLTLRFRHAHLVAGLDGISFGPDAFLAMRYYPEGTLARQLAHSPLSLEATLRVLADVASGLAYLHHAGAIHQDVKTQNIYLEPCESAGNFRAALGDFGSTYYMAQGGEVSGSPFYMAPEVYQGEMTGPPSDVYSFGVLAHELLTGDRPHLGDSYESLMISHLTHFPSPMAVVGVAKPLSRLLDATLAKRPGDRPSSAALRKALLACLGEPDALDEDPEPAESPAATVDRGRAGRHGLEGPGATGRPAAPGKVDPNNKVDPNKVVPNKVTPGNVTTVRPVQPGLPADTIKRSWNPFKKKK